MFKFLFVFLSVLVSCDESAAQTKNVKPKKATAKVNQQTKADTSKKDFSVKASDIKGTYVCVSGGVPELQADGTISKASVDAAQATVRSYSSALKYLFRGDGTFADLTYGEKYASDPKYNGTYKIENGKVNMYSRGILFYTLQPARDYENKVSLIQVHEAKDRYKAQFCRLVKQ